jgi:hypothetical protein
MYGKPKPLVYGCTKIAANMIDYAGFTSKPTSSGGKGGGGGVSGYNYWSDLILALCEGGASGIVGVQRVWQDKDCYTLSYYGLSLMTGARPQAPWASWLSKWPSRALGYSGTACVAALQVALGSDGSPPNWNFEVQALLGTEQDPNWAGSYDAMPSAVLLDLLSNPYYGAGFTAARIADLVTGAHSFQTYCTACGFAISPAFSDQDDAATCIQQILDATNSEIVWSAGPSGMTLKVIPCGDTPITANGVTYTPNTTPLYDLTNDDFLGVIGKDGKPTGNDPIATQRSSVQDIKNDVPVEFWDRTSSYDVSVVDSPESSDVSMNGLKQDSPLTLHLITRIAHAQQISAIKAQRNVFVRNTYTFKVGWQYILLEPMDLVTLTDSITGLTRKIVRIVSVDMPDETSEEDGLAITAEEWPFGIGTATLYPAQANSGNSAASSPGPSVTSVVIFEPLAAMSESGGPEIWIGASGPPTLWGGCNVWVSVDGGSSYGAAPVGTINASARIGALTATLPSAADPDTTDTLAVNLAASLGTLNSTSANGRDAFATACLVDSEIISYLTATLTGANAYNLTSLRRGAYGSTIAAHSSGASFMFLDDAVFKLQFDKSLIGKTLHVKFQSFNGVGSGYQDLSTCTAYSYTPAGVVYLVKPLYVSADGTYHVSSGLIAQGGLAPFQSIALTYSMTASAVTVSVAAQSMLRSDGSTFSVVASSASCTGLSTSTTYYLYPYISITDGKIYLANGSPAPTSANSLMAAQAALDGRYPLSALSVTTPASGSGGGGAGGGCPEAAELVDIQGKGQVAAGKVMAGDCIRGKCLQTGEDVYRVVLQTRAETCHAWRILDGHRVSPCEAVYDNGQWTPAFRVAGTAFDGSVGIKAEIEVEADDYGEHNYYLVSGTQRLIHNGMIGS